MIDRPQCWLCGSFLSSPKKRAPAEPMFRSDWLTITLNKRLNDTAMEAVMPLVLKMHQIIEAEERSMNEDREIPGNPQQQAMGGASLGQGLRASPMKYPPKVEAHRVSPVEEAAAALHNARNRLVRMRHRLRELLERQVGPSDELRRGSDGDQDLRAGPQQEVPRPPAYTQLSEALDSMEHELSALENTVEAAELRL